MWFGKFSMNTYKGGNLTSSLITRYYLMPSFNIAANQMQCWILFLGRHRYKIEIKRTYNNVNVPCFHLEFLWDAFFSQQDDS